MDNDRIFQMAFGEAEAPKGVDMNRAFEMAFGPEEKSSTVGGVLSSLGSGLAEGLTTELPSMVGRAAEFVGAKTGISPLEDIGNSLAEWAERKRTDLYGERVERPTAEKWAYEGAKMLAPSIIPGGVFTAGARVVKGVGGLVKMAKAADAAGDTVNATRLWAQANKAASMANKIGAGGVAGIFGTSQAQSTIDTANQRADELEKAGRYDEAQEMRARADGMAPYLTGGIEAAGEYFGTKYLGKLLGLSEAEILKRGAKDVVKTFLKTLGVELGTEFGQAGGQATVEKVSGIRPEADPLDEALDVLGPTVVMTLLTGGTAGGMKALADRIGKPEPQTFDDKVQAASTQAAQDTKAGEVANILQAKTPDEAIASFQQATAPPPDPLSERLREIDEERQRRTQELFPSPLNVQNQQRIEGIERQDELRRIREPRYQGLLEGIPESPFMDAPPLLQSGTVPQGEIDAIEADRRRAEEERIAQGARERAVARLPENLPGYVATGGLLQQGEQAQGALRDRIAKGTEAVSSDEIVGVNRVMAGMSAPVINAPEVFPPEPPATPPVEPAKPVAPTPEPPKESKREKALKEYRDYVASLTPEEKEAAKDLIQDAPRAAGLQMNAIRKRLLEKPVTPEKPKFVHDYSSTQVNLPKPQADEIRSFAAKIPEKEIYTEPDEDYGREKEPHITVRYGLESIDPAEVSPAFEGMGPIKAKMGKVSIFESDKYDVVKVDIDSEDLRAANKRVGETVDLPGETFKDYKPHATIAYVKKGEGKKYVGNKLFEGKEIVIDEVVLSAKDGKMHPIKLNGKPDLQPKEKEAPTSDTKVQGEAEGEVKAKREAWEMPEEDYVESRFEEEEGKRRASSNVKFERQRNESIRKRLSNEWFDLNEKAFIEGKDVKWKPAWAMTAEESAARSDDTVDDSLRRSHKEMVREALSAGKPVPERILNEYPDLAPKKEEKPEATKLTESDFRTLEWSVTSQPPRGRMSRDPRAGSYPKKVEREEIRSAGFTNEYFSPNRPVPMTMDENHRAVGFYLFTKTPLSLRDVSRWELVPVKTEERGRIAKEYYTAKYGKKIVELYKEEERGSSVTWRGAFVHKTGKYESGWQVTYFDENGFSGDTNVKTEAEGIGTAIEDGYNRFSPGLVDESMKDPKFMEGVDKANRIQKENKERLEASRKKAAEAVEVEKDGKDTTVSVPMPKKKADSLTPKQQKTYLLEEIDKAIEAAPEGMEEIGQLRLDSPNKDESLKDFQERTRKSRDAALAEVGSVTIEVPGDGTFTLINRKGNLEAFKKQAKGFPLSTIPSKPTGIPSARPTGKRISGEGVKYHNEFKPRKEGLIESVNKANDSYYDGRLYSNGAYIVEVKEKPKIKSNLITDKTKLPPLADRLQEGKTVYAEILGETYRQGNFTPYVHVRSEGKDIFFDAKYFDSILTIHPDAELSVWKGEVGIAVFTDGGKRVALLSPVKTDAEGDAETNELFESRVKRKPDAKKEAPPKKEEKAPEKAKAEKEKPKSEGTIEDVGEKLWGSRKDKAALQADAAKEYTDEELATLPLSKIWPKETIDEVEDTLIAAVATTVRAEVPPKPRTTWKVNQWVEKVKSVRELHSTFLGMLEDEKLDRAGVLERMRERSGLKSFATKVELLTNIDRKHWDRIGDVQEAPDAYRFTQDGKRVASPFVMVKIDDRSRAFNGFTKITDALTGINEVLEGSPAGKRMEFEVRGRGNDFFINKKGDPEYRKLATFSDPKAAQEYRRSHYEELVQSWERVKDRDNVKETDVRTSENRPRTGADHRKGRDVKAEEFASTFGFRGVEFGNWVSQGKNDKERQGMLNQAFDALMDLADIIGVPPKAISLNGELGLGFGSRGHGWASAHYEPDTLVINLTKTRGAGAMAHEFFHALDHYFQRKRGTTGFGEGAFITYNPETYYQHKVRKDQRLPAKDFEQAISGEKSRYRIPKPEDWVKVEGVRPEVAEAFAELVNKLNESPMAKRSRMIDKGKKGYWSKIIERGARAFENYVIAKMAEKGYQNDYLANVVNIEAFARDPARYPYLLKEELAPVEKAFDDLFATIETKETERGIALYSTRSPGVKRDVTGKTGKGDITTGENPDSPSGGFRVKTIRTFPDGTRIVDVTDDRKRLIAKLFQFSGNDSQAIKEGVEWATEQGLYPFEKRTVNPEAEFGKKEIKISDISYGTLPDTPPRAEYDAKPIIVSLETAETGKQYYDLIDGYHRLANAVRGGKKSIKAIVVTDEELSLSKDFGHDDTINEDGMPEAEWIDYVIEKAKSLPNSSRPAGAGQFSLASSFSTLSPQEIKDSFKGQEATLNEDGSITVNFKSGLSLKVKSVEEITEDKLSFEVAYKRRLAPGERIAGKYIDGEIEIVRGVGDRFTLEHEKFHFIEDAGLIRPLEIRAINATLRGQGLTPSKESRAKWVEDNLYRRDKVRNSILRSMLQRIGNFIDSLANLFTVTSRSVLRAMESGEFFSRSVDMGAPLAFDGKADSLSDKSLVDGLVGDTHFIADLANTRTFKKFGLGGFDIPSVRVVLGRMSSMLHNGEIGDVIVESIPVNMMDAFGGEKPSPEMLLHDISMLADLLPINSNDPVPIPDVALKPHEIIASAVAKNISAILDLARSADNGRTAKSARVDNLGAMDESGVARVATKNIPRATNMGSESGNRLSAVGAYAFNHGNSPKGLFVSYNKKTKVSTIKTFDPKNPNILYAEKAYRGRAGQPIDDYEGAAPPVNWDEPDLQMGGAWTKKSVAEFLGVPKDKHIYRAMVDLSDLSFKRAERESAKETRKGEAEIDQYYIDEAETVLEDYTDKEKNKSPWHKDKFNEYDGFLPWDFEDGYTDKDVKDLARELQARSEEVSYDEEEFSRKKSGFPPIVVTRKADGAIAIEDGNHRADIWGREYDVAPAWVNDEMARKGNVQYALVSDRVALTRESKPLKNSLTWDQPLTDEAYDRLLTQAKKEFKPEADLKGIASAQSLDRFERILNVLQKADGDGEGVYGFLVEFMAPGWNGSNRNEASRFLMKAGFEGIKFGNGIESRYAEFDENEGKAYYALKPSKERYGKVTPAPKNSPAFVALQGLVQAHSKRFQLGGAEEAPALREVAVAGEYADTLRSVARLFRSGIIFFEGEHFADGAVLPQFRRAILVNVSASRPGLCVVGHELLHQLRNNDIQAYAALAKLLQPEVRKFGEFRQGINSGRSKAGLSPLDDYGVLEELFADFSGEQFMDSRFWGKLAKKNPSLFEKVTSLLKRIIDRITGKITGKHFAGIEAAREVLADAMARYAEKGAEGFEGEAKFAIRIENSDIVNETFGSPISTSPVRSAIKGMLDTSNYTREAIKKHLSDLRTQVIDRRHPLQKLGRLPYQLHRMLGNYHATLSTFLEHGELSWEDNALDTKTKGKGFLPWLRSMKGDGRKLFYWMAVKRAEALENDIDPETGKGRENWLTPDRRERLLNEIFKDLSEDQIKAKTKEYEKLNDEFQKWNQNIIEIAKESGLLSQEQIDSWMRDFYLPFYRLMENETTRDEFLKAPRKSKQHISAQIKRLKGGEEKLGDPIENILRNWSHLIQEAQRNKARAEAAGVAVPMGLAEEVKGSDLTKILGSKTAKRWGVRETGSARVSKYFEDKDEANFQREEMEGKTGKEHEIVEQKTTSVMFGRKEDFQILTYQRDGRTVYLRVNDPALFEAMSEINAKAFDSKLLKVMGSAKRLLTAGATFGPAFRIANLLRDTLHVAVVSKSFTPFIDTSKGVLQVWKQSPDYISLMASGGGFGQGWVDSGDPKAMARSIEKIIKREGEGARGRILNTPRKMLEFWEKVGHASEMAARVQLYSNLKGKGATHLEAAFQARDILDFFNSGAANSVRAMNAVVPFLNARIQGLDRLYRGAKEDPKAFFVKGALVAGASLLLWSLFKDDDRYKELEDWEKWQYHHFWIGDQHFRLPKAFEVGAIFSSLFESSAALLDGQEDFDFFGRFLLHTLTETFQLNMPALFAPGVEAYANRSAFTGRPIESLSLERLPPGERSKAWTPEVLKALGRGLNISPLKMEHIIRGHMATFGTMFITAADAIYRTAVDAPERPAARIDDMPAIGRFVRSESGTKYATRYYEFAREVEELSATINNYKRLGNIEDAVKLAKENPEKLRYKMFVGKANRMFSEIRKEEQRIWVSKMTSDEKRDKLMALQKKKNAYYKKAYEQVYKK